MRILAIDPSISSAAAALLESDQARPDRGRYVRHWHIRPKGDNLGARVVDLGNQVCEIVKDAAADVIVVEMPADRPMHRAGFARRSVLDLPNYGAAVGACVMVAAWAGPRAQAIRDIPLELCPTIDGIPVITVANLSAETAFQLFTPSVCDWTGRDVPSSANDEHKTRRVAFVCELYGLAPGMLGPKTTAGNAADAVLLARWGLWRAG